MGSTKFVVVKAKELIRTAVFAVLGVIIIVGLITFFLHMGDNENTGLYRYIDGDGNPMQLEVPADQHTKAIESMRTKIKEGRVPGVTDPDDAENLIRLLLALKPYVGVDRCDKIDGINKILKFVQLSEKTGLFKSFL